MHKNFPRYFLLLLLLPLFLGTFFFTSFLLAEPLGREITGMSPEEQEIWRQENQSLSELQNDMERSFGEFQENPTILDSGMDPNTDWVSYLAEQWEKDQREWGEEIQNATQEIQITFRNIEVLERNVRQGLREDMQSFMIYLRNNQFSESIVQTFASFQSDINSILNNFLNFQGIANTIGNFLQSQARVMANLALGFESQVYRTTTFEETMVNSDENYHSEFLINLRNYIDSPENSPASQSLLHSLKDRVLGLTPTLVLNSILSMNLTANTPESLRQTQWNQDHTEPFANLEGSYKEQGHAFRDYFRNDWIVWGTFFAKIQVPLREAFLEVKGSLQLKDTNAEENGRLYRSYERALDQEAQKWKNERLETSRRWDEEKLEIQNAKTNIEQSLRRKDREMQAKFQERWIALQEALETGNSERLVEVEEETVRFQKSMENRVKESSDSFLSRKPENLNQVARDHSSLFPGLTRLANIYDMEEQAKRHENQTLDDLIDSLRNSREFKPGTPESVVKKFSKDGACVGANQKIKEECKAEYDSITFKSWESVEIENGKIKLTKSVYSGVSNFTGGDATNFDNYQAGKSNRSIYMEIPGTMARSSFLPENQGFFTSLTAQENRRIWEQFNRNQTQFQNQTFGILSSNAWQKAQKNLQDISELGYSRFVEKTEQAIEFQTTVNRLLEHLYGGGTVKQFIKNFQEEKIRKAVSKEVARTSGLSEQFVSEVIAGLANERAKKKAEKKAQERQWQMVGAGAVTALVSLIPGVNITAPAVFFTLSGLGSVAAGDQLFNGGRMSSIVHDRVREVNDYLSNVDLQRDLQGADFGSQMRSILDSEILRGASLTISQQTGIPPKEVANIIKAWRKNEEEKKQREKARVQKAIQNAQLALHVGTTLLSSGTVPNLTNVLPSLKNIAKMKLTTVDYLRLSNLALSTSSGYVQGGTHGALGGLVSSVSLPVPGMASVLPSLSWDPEKKAWYTGFRVALPKTQGFVFGVDGRGSVQMERDILPTGSPQSFQWNVSLGQTQSFGITSSFGGGSSVGFSFGNQGLGASAEIAPDQQNFVSLSMQGNGPVQVGLGRDDIEYLQVSNASNQSLVFQASSHLTEQFRNLELRRFDSTNTDAWQERSVFERPREGQASRPLDPVTGTITGVMGTIAGLLSARIFSRGSSSNAPRPNPNPQNSPNQSNTFGRTRESETQNHSNYGGEKPTPTPQNPTLDTWRELTRDGLRSKESVQKFEKWIQTQTQKNRWEVVLESQRNAKSSADFTPRKDIQPLEFRVLDTPSHFQWKPGTKTDSAERLIRDSLSKERSEWGKGVGTTEPESQSSNRFGETQAKYAREMQEIERLVKDVQKLNLSEPHSFQIPGTQAYHLTQKIQKSARELQVLEPILSREMDSLERDMQLLGELSRDSSLGVLSQSRVKEALESWRSLQEREGKNPEILEQILHHPTQGDVQNFLNQWDKRKEALHISQKISKERSLLLDLRRHFSEGKGFPNSQQFTESWNRTFPENTLLGKIQETYRTIREPVYQNQKTGEIRIGSPESNATFLASGSFHNQSNPDSDFSRFIRDNFGKDLEASLRSQWCAAHSQWAMLRKELGAHIVPDFPEFVRSMQNLGYIDSNTMYLENTSAIANHFGGSLGFQFDRSPEFPRDREKAYEVFAQELLHTQSNSVTLRVKDSSTRIPAPKEPSGHTISLVRNQDGRTWTVIDTGSAKAHGTIFDPKDFRNSVLFSPKNSPYGEDIPLRFDTLRRTSSPTRTR